MLLFVRRFSRPARDLSVFPPVQVPLCLSWRAAEAAFRNPCSSRTLAPPKSSKGRAAPCPDSIRGEPRRLAEQQLGPTGRPPLIEGPAPPSQPAVPPGFRPPNRKSPTTLLAGDFDHAGDTTAGYVDFADGQQGVPGSGKNLGRFGVEDKVFK